MTDKPPKPLKEQNYWPLRFIIAGNCVVLYLLVKHDALKAADMAPALEELGKILPVGLGGVMSSVLTGLLSSATKERLVYWRWEHGLPGHRAFSHYAKKDTRISVAALEKALGTSLPVDPADQNRDWYKLHKTVDTTPAVLQAHKQFLLLREYTGLATLFLFVLGSAGLWLIPSARMKGMYLGALLLQYLLVRKAAANSGERLVLTVLALTSAAT